MKNILNFLLLIKSFLSNNKSVFVNFLNIFYLLWRKVYKLFSVNSLFFIAKKLI